MGFLPNGDLIIVSSSIEDYLKDCKIYRYSVENKPTTNTTFWKCSQIYDIEFTESLKYSRSYYSVENKPTTNTTFLEYSQIHDIELTEGLKGYYGKFHCFILCQTK